MASEAMASTLNQTLLGEGLRWDARRQEMLGVDILAGRVYRGHVESDGELTLVREYWVPATVGAIVPVAVDEGWVVSAGRGFVLLAPDGSLRPIAPVARLGPG